VDEELGVVLQVRVDHLKCLCVVAGQLYALPPF
jgi:hypothetical protein